MRENKRIVKVVGFSEKPETYVDIIVALQRQLQPDEIKITFVASEQMTKTPSQGREQTVFANEIHDLLLDVSKNHIAYKNCDRIQINTDEIRREELNVIFEDTLAVDVTAAPKDLAINVIANSLRYGGPPIYYIKWLTKFSGKRNRIGVDPYYYEDLTRLEEARILSKSYRTQTITLLAMILIVAFLAIVAIFSKWYPPLGVFNDVLSVISVVAGFTGLIIAVYQTGIRESVMRSSKKRN